MSSYDKDRGANDPVCRGRKKASGNAWQQANRPKINAYRRELYANDPKYVEAVRNSWLKTAYGLTLKDYNAMVERQDGRKERGRVGDRFAAVEGPGLAERESRAAIRPIRPRAIPAAVATSGKRPIFT